jgi:hypothetical protein
MFSSLDRRACETVYADYQLKTPRQAQTAWRGGIEDVSEQRHTPELASQNTGVEIYPWLSRWRIAKMSQSARGTAKARTDERSPQMGHPIGT